MRAIYLYIAAAIVAVLIVIAFVLAFGPQAEHMPDVRHGSAIAPPTSPA
jgi:hypothetical protein